MDKKVEGKKKAEGVVQEAHRIIHEDREGTYGDPDTNIQMIADLWSTYTGVKLTVYDACNMMELLKIARRKNNPLHRDSLVDSVGYVALQERIAMHRGDKLS